MLLFFLGSPFFVLLKDHAVEYPAAEGDPVTGPAQLSPLPDSVIGYALLEETTKQGGEK